MKNIIATIVLGCFLNTQIAYAAIEAKCLNDKGKTSPCSLDNQNGNLVIQYKMKKLAHLNKTIDGHKITRLTGGEYSRRRVAESVATAVLLTPLALFGLFSKKKIDNFGIEYTDQNNNAASTLIQSKKKYSEGIKSMLQSISGQQIVYQEAPAKK